MNIIEQHPFGYFLPEDADKLIIGSFPCLGDNGYGDWFYSGSGKNDFWKLLSEVYMMPIETKKQKTDICRDHEIAITDIALKVERIKNNCSDSNLKIHEYNKIGINACLIPSVRKILFTSKFVEKHFLICFPEISISYSTLLSPSPTANRYIARLEEYKNLKISGLVSSPYEYRLIKYKEQLLNDH